MIKMGWARGGRPAMIGVVVALAVVGTAATGASAAGATTTLVSLSTAGGHGDFRSSIPAISTHGRYVAFISTATNLVPGDTNLVDDVFVRDRLTGVTQRVSVATGGGQSDHISFLPAISADGRYVAFVSNATNLVAGDTNAAGDVFVRDLVTGVTRRVSVATGGAQANDDSSHPSMSADGRYIAFDSTASNLVAGDTNGVSDVFVRDMVTGVTRRVSVATAGAAQGDSFSLFSSISADGRFVAFDSAATNLVPGDTNGVIDGFVRDRITGVTRRVSVATAGAAQATAGTGSFVTMISADGGSVLFTSDATNLVPGDTNNAIDVFVRVIATGVTRRVAVATGALQADRSSGGATISADGRFVAFASDATNLVAGDTNAATDVFVRDLQVGVTRRVSVRTGGGQADGISFDGVISADGGHIAFVSNADNLAAGDTNLANDVFVRDQLGDSASQPR